MNKSFEEILNELGQELSMSLTPDKLGHCRLVFEDVTVQIENQHNGENLLVCAVVDKLPPGAFRETLLEGALIANAVPPPWSGVLAYSEDIDSLVLFELLDAQNLSGKDLMAYLNGFNNKCRQWQEAIKTGQLPSAFNSGGGGPGGGMLGLR